MLVYIRLLFVFTPTSSSCRFDCIALTARKHPRSIFKTGTCLFPAPASLTGKSRIYRNKHARFPWWHSRYVCLNARSQNHICLWQISWHLRMLDVDFEERDHDNDVDYWPLPWLLLRACRLVRSARTLLHEPKPEALRPSSLPYSMCSK